MKDIRDIDKNMKEYVSSDNGEVKFIDLNNDYLMGRIFKADDYVRCDRHISENIDTLMHHPAGFNISFKTNSSFIKIKALLAGGAYMSHMTAVGTIGFSLYVLHGKKWVFMQTAKTTKSDYELDLLKDIDKGMHTYRLYFPLYQWLKEAYVGVEKKAKFEFIKYDYDKLVIYGTSISQGGCASRPGMDYGAILGRMNNLDVINLGFSGSCHLEQEIVPVLNQIDMKYLIFEVESNSKGPQVFVPGMEYIMANLKNKENIKIYLISHFDEGLGLVNKQYLNYRKDFYNCQKEFCESHGITFLDGTKMIKNLGLDGTVDSAHLTDLGFYEVAKKLSKIIQK